jgi:membrane protein DedA with SNARE-associated domain
MPVASVVSAVTSAVGDWGLYAVFLLMVLDAVFPAASEIVMVYAGAVASGAFASQHIVLFGHELDRGFPSYLGVALAGTVGYTIGSIAGWAIGRYGGRRYLARRGRWLHLDEERLDRAERWFERWEDWAVFLGRLTPVVRSFVSIPAGVLEARFGRYVLLTLAGSAIWCFAFAGGGWAAGASWEEIHNAFEYADYAVVAAVAAVAVWLFIRRRGRRRRVAEETTPR